MDVMTWFSDYWPALAAAVVGIVICTCAGLLSLVPDPEQPGRFLPVYAVALTLFLGGLALILWCEDVSEYLGGILQT